MKELTRVEMRAADGTCIVWFMALESISSLGVPESEPVEQRLTFVGIQVNPVYAEKDWEARGNSDDNDAPWNAVADRHIRKAATL